MGSILYPLDLCAAAVVRKAGRILLDTALKEKDQIKDSANFVAQLGYQVQDFLVTELNNILPGCNIITKDSECNLFQFKNYTWILDPVSGTTNVIHDYRHSAISLALFICGKPMLAVIFDPYRDELFGAETGEGSYLNHQRISVSTNQFLKDSLISFGTTPNSRDQTDHTFAIAKKVFLNCQDIRCTGSPALDLAYVACGRNDGFLEVSLMPWDYAAGIIILEAAGGKVTTWEGERPKILSPNSILATNGLIHKELIHLL